jgi:hypothetical protein
MKISRIINTLTGFCLMVLLQVACTGNPKPVESLPWIPTDLASAAKLINDRCPEMVDPETRLDSVILSPEGLMYFYTLPNKDHSGIASSAFEAYLLPEIIDNIRTNPRMEIFRDSLVTMSFNYLDRKGELITEFTVEPELYR